MSYVIFSDSGSDYSDSMAKKMNVRIIPLSYIMHGKEYTSITDELMKETYQSLRNKESVSTSCANVFTITKLLEEELIKGNDILYLAFSSGLSATYANGLKACDALRKNIPIGRSASSILSRLRWDRACFSPTLANSGIREKVWKTLPDFSNPTN